MQLIKKKERKKEKSACQASSRMFFTLMAAKNHLLTAILESTLPNLSIDFHFLNNSNFKKYTSIQRMLFSDILIMFISGAENDM